MRINETIAEDFDCSLETRKVHVRRVLRKEIILSLSDRATLIFFCCFFVLFVFKLTQSRIRDESIGPGSTRRLRRSAESELFLCPQPQESLHYPRS